MLPLKNKFKHMKQLLLLSLLFTLSCSKPKETNPKKQLSSEQIEEFKYQIIRYIERLPRLANDENKFEPQFDKTYRLSAKNCELLQYYVDEENYIYFAISKIAPSIKLKKTATIGRLKISGKKTITYYEEALRTWKMEPNELNEKTTMLFTKYINKEDLSPYYTQNSQPDFYIEFPDKQSFYNIQKRKWEIHNKE
jgi:hypothetical protein